VVGGASLSRRKSLSKTLTSYHSTLRRWKEVWEPSEGPKKTPLVRYLAPNGKRASGGGVYVVTLLREPGSDVQNSKLAGEGP
jgi:hypothetical protein